MEEELRQFFKSIGRGRLKKIWRKVAAGDTGDLQGEDRRYAAQMAEHSKEYFEAFEAADTRHLDPDSETDAYLHVSLHVIVESQLESKDPAEAAALCQSLEDKGCSHHEAVHLLAAVFVPFLFDVLKTGSEFDREGYRRLLKKAGPLPPEEIWEMLEQEAYGEEDAAEESLSEKVYRLRIELEGAEPPIWRRILVPAAATFSDLHAAIQGAMGWKDRHLHRFEVRDPDTGRPRFFGRPLEDDRWQDNVSPGAGRKIAGFLHPQDPQCRYVYDYGDNWVHRVVLEEVLPMEPGGTYPVCLEGERACPPENVGGLAGYEDLLRVLGDPEDERHEEIRLRVGGFDPDRFDPNEAVFASPES